MTDNKVKSSEKERRQRRGEGDSFETQKSRSFLLMCLFDCSVGEFKKISRASVESNPFPCRFVSDAFNRERMRKLNLLSCRKNRKERR